MFYQFALKIFYHCKRKISLTQHDTTAFFSHINGPCHEIQDKISKGAKKYLIIKGTCCLCILQEMVVMLMMMMTMKKKSHLRKYNDYFRFHYKKSMLKCFCHPFIPTQTQNIHSLIYFCLRQFLPWILCISQEMFKCLKKVTHTHNRMSRLKYLS